MFWCQCYCTPSLLPDFSQLSLRQTPSVPAPGVHLREVSVLLDSSYAEMGKEQPEQDQL